MNWTTSLLVHHLDSTCLFLQFDFSPETSDMMGDGARNLSSIERRRRCDFGGA